MKNAFVIVTLTGLLSACAVAQLPQPEPARPVQEAPAAVADETDAADVSDDEAADEENLPKVALSSDLLYQLLKAEFDFREGNWKEPYAALIEASKQTRDPRLARRAAEMALSVNEHPSAMAAVGTWRELSPDSDEAARAYLGLAVLTDKLAEAEGILRQRLADAPITERGATMFQARQFIGRAKDKAAAAAMFERLLAPYRHMVEARILLAQSAFGRGDKVQAEAEARAALALKPDSEIAVLTLAQVAVDQGSVEAMLAKFIAANPKAREVRAAHARILVDQKQYEKARDSFEVLLKDQPEDLGTLYALGILSMQLDDPESAEEYLSHFTEVLAKSPDDERDPSRVLLMLSQLAEQRGDLPAALKWIGKIDSEDPALYFGAQVKRAQLMAKQGELAGARKVLAGLSPSEATQQAQVVLTEGQILRDAGQGQAAYLVLEDGARKFPKNPDLLYDFALQAEKLGRVDVMEKALREVMVLAPDNHHAYNALGYSLAERNVRLAEALALIDKALKMAPEDPFIMDSLGWVHYRMGKLDAAEALLRKAYALRKDAEIAVHLGEVLWRKGAQEEARKLLREARAKDPKSDTLRNTLARLQLKL
ncbi:tetratricopeptide repeat protein [Massilia sp. RP-1-19]|uniref:Tetratricopeptide repeat protein n=1 Tax=Massilia polaris TaxID=2728846 RepID=A0A848HM78_9BURK|nr:tetratricopeptide repeat protein [Massilia polaris]NML63006.1 tetratricopeptide repeat protein [Massilia polaris]